MWHKPQLMTVVADLLLLVGAAALVVAGLIWALRLPLFPLRQVTFVEAPVEVGRGEIERALAATLRGNFFSADLEAVRLAIEKLPWVRRAEVRRRWPNAVEVRLEEHRAVARWGDASGQLVNSHGEVFAATLASRDTAMPVFSGPPGAAADVLRRHGEFAHVLAAVGRSPRRISLSARLAWQLRLDDGLLIELGREQAKAPIGARLERFVAAYPQAVAARQPRALAADLRYPNGFALSVAGVAGGETKGKS